MHTPLDSLPHAYTKVTLFNLPKTLITPYTAKPLYQNSHFIFRDCSAPTSLNNSLK